MKQRLYLLCGCLVLLLLLGSCSPWSDNSLKGKLRIVAEQDIHIYHALGLREFKELNPQLEIEFVNLRNLVDNPLDMYAKYTELVVEQRPDVVIASELTFPMLTAERRLVQLEPMVLQDELPLKEMVPAVEERLRDFGHGQLYGLSPSFSRSVIFFRTDLFDEYEILYPQNQMSWKELLALAQRFPPNNESGQRIFGFHDGFQGSADSLISSIGTARGLSYLDWERREITLDTEGWRQVYGLAVEALRSGSIYDQAQHADVFVNHTKPLDPVKLFMEGRIAMLFGGEDTFRRLERHATDISWTMVTEPVDPQNRSQADVYIHDVYAIYEASTNVDASWALLKHMNKQPIKTSANSRGISAWTGTWNKLVGREAELAAVWRLLDYKPNSANPLWELPQEFYTTMTEIRRKGLEQMLAGEAAVGEALQDMEKEGQETLNQAVLSGGVR